MVPETIITSVKLTLWRCSILEQKDFTPVARSLDAETQGDGQTLGRLVQRSS